VYCVQELLDSRAQRVRSAVLVSRDSQVLADRKVSPEPSANGASQAPTVHPVRLARREPSASSVRSVLKDNRDPPASRDVEETSARRDLRALRDLRVLPEELAHRVSPGLRAH